MGDHFLVATGKEGVVGYVLGSLQSAAEGAWILSLVVAPSVRRLGIATLLVQQLSRQFVERGATFVKIHVSPNNPSAMNLYDRLGFFEQTYEEHYFGRGEGRWVLEASLSAAN